MVSVYVILSLKDKATYVGMALDAVKRLKEHNSGKNRYTKAHHFHGRLSIQKNIRIGLQPGSEKSILNQQPEKTG